MKSELIFSLNRTTLVIFTGYSLFFKISFLIIIQWPKNINKSLKLKSQKVWNITNVKWMGRVLELNKKMSSHDVPFLCACIYHNDCCCLLEEIMKNILYKKGYENAIRKKTRGEKCKLKKKKICHDICN